MSGVLLEFTTRTLQANVPVPGLTKTSPPWKVPVSEGACSVHAYCAASMLQSIMHASIAQSVCVYYIIYA